MNETKEQYMSRMSKQYDKLQEGRTWAEDISNDIKEMRSRGYNIIVMGDTVKITLAKI